MPEERRPGSLVRARLWADGATFENRVLLAPFALHLPEATRRVLGGRSSRVLERDRDDKTPRKRRGSEHSVVRGFNSPSAHAPSRLSRTQEVIEAHNARTTSPAES